MFLLLIWSRLSGRIVQICVEYDGKWSTSYVHEQLITQRSKFIQDAIKSSGDLKEGFHIVKLTGVHLWTLNYYLILVYTNKLVSKEFVEWEAYTQLYVLAEKLQDRIAKNQIIDGMHTAFQEKASKDWRLVAAFSTEYIKLLYDHTPSNSPARALVVDMFANFVSGEFLRQRQSTLPAEFFIDIALRLMKTPKCLRPTTALPYPSSHYHELYTAEENKSEQKEKETSTSPKPVTAAIDPAKELEKKLVGLSVNPP